MLINVTTKDIYKNENILSYVYEHGADVISYGATAKHNAIHGR